ncbi:hypothetical protein OPV22_029685 [Ensete ventricosum]|uniref:Uncharacterized protein n=1 Tax=Ensete ventricosum TaxID=4639 RepID=A0AAV8QBW3_ENSVE|nr:hypothetical protein OPV22_029685 [Ensete ventricosum]
MGPRSLPPSHPRPRTHSHLTCPVGSLVYRFRLFPVFDFPVLCSQECVSILDLGFGCPPYFDLTDRNLDREK